MPNPLATITLSLLRNMISTRPINKKQSCGVLPIFLYARDMQMQWDESGLWKMVFKKNWIDGMRYDLEIDTAKTFPVNLILTGFD